MGLFDGFGKRATETRKKSKGSKKLIEEERKRTEKEWSERTKKYDKDAKES